MIVHYNECGFKLCTHFPTKPYLVHTSSYSISTEQICFWYFPDHQKSEKVTKTFLSIFSLRLMELDISKGIIQGPFRYLLSSV